MSLAIYISSSKNNSGRGPASRSQLVWDYAPIVNQGRIALGAGDYIDLQTGEITKTRTSQSDLMACCGTKLTAIRSARSTTTTDVLVDPSNVNFDDVKGTYEVQVMQLRLMVKAKKAGKGYPTEIRPHAKGIMFVDCDSGAAAKVQALSYLPGGEVEIRWVTYAPGRYIRR
jgi:hypothetical protein